MRVMYGIMSGILQCTGYMLFLYLGGYNATHSTEEPMFLLGCISAALLVEAGHRLRRLVTDPYPPRAFAIHANAPFYMQWYSQVATITQAIWGAGIGPSTAVWELSTSNFYTDMPLYRHDLRILHGPRYQCG